MSNHEIVRHCAATLANVKVGNLFTVPCQSKNAMLKIIREKNTFFNGKGVFVRVLKWNEKNALVFVYRPRKLTALLGNPCIQHFLKGYGYQDFSLESAFACLEEHLQKSDFPHEIGVFLGYPLEDVKGFIQHQGKNYYISGLWKVYHDPENAAKMFRRYHKCRRIYLERFAQGFDMARLTVGEQNLINKEILV